MAANKQTYIHTHVRNAVMLVWGEPEPSVRNTIFLLDGD